MQNIFTVLENVKFELMNGVNMMKGVFIRRSVPVIFLVILSLVTSVDAATIYADSCSYEDVQSAINDSSKGDLVVVPPGECAWGSQVSIPNYREITLMGAGIDLTIINDGGVKANKSASRITGFTFNEGPVVMDGDNWRVDHCKFHRDSLFTHGVFISGSSSSHPTGLIDNCIFFNTRVLVYGTNYMLFEGNQQHEIWAKDLNLGEFNGVVYIEDCDFEYNIFGNAIDSNTSAAFVFRFNSLKDVYIECHSVQGDNRATRKWEIYGNDLNNPGENIYAPYRLRGGTGVVFNEIITGNWDSNSVVLDNVRSYSDRGSGGFCDGNSLWDGNEDPTGYPCRDQIGRGPDVVQWDDDPPQYYNQPLMPAYAWSNKRSSGQNVPFSVASSSVQHIKENRDFYNQTSNFDGTSGVGVGTYANRPSTCTPGVAYWATDRGTWNKSGSGGQGRLYKCVAEDQWELYYTPYTYPHPLRAETDNPIEVLPPSELSADPTTGE